MPQIKFFNIRVGLACNSSSSHSILFLPSKDKSITTDQNTEFGWDFFTAADTESKNNYLYQLIQSAFQKLVPPSDQKNFYKKFFPDMDSISTNGYIDHQSVVILPSHLDGTINTLFIEEFQKFLLQDNVVIAGGNDNTEETHSLTGTEKANLDILPREGDSSDWLARKDLKHDFWTLFNRSSGSKIRFSFSDLTITPTKSSAPELVDIKITDFCPFGCTFCYQDSTLEGQHASMETMKDIVLKLKEAQVFEIACLAEGTMVLTKSGYKKIEHLVIGEELFTSDGSLKKIKNLISSEKESIKIVGNQGFSVTCTPDHPFISNGQIVEAQNLLGQSLDQLDIKFIDSPNSLDQNTGIKIKSITPVGIQKVFDIALEDDSTHIFTLSHGVLTHNCGGGETTLHPNFVEIVKLFKDNGIVFNFTTRNYSIFKSPHAKEILDNSGAIAFSIGSVDDLKKVLSACMESKHPKANLHAYQSSINIQYVMGTTDLKEFKNILLESANKNLNITLLGYKTVGRGDTFIAESYDGWIDIVREVKETLNKEGKYLQTSIDTALAAQYKNELEEMGVNISTFHTTEGNFSLYIDAVKNTMGPSSYSGDYQETSFDNTWLEKYESIGMEAPTNKPKKVIKIK